MVFAVALVAVDETPTGWCGRVPSLGVYGVGNAFRLGAFTICGPAFAFEPQMVRLRKKRLCCVCHRQRKAAFPNEPRSSVS